MSVLGIIISAALVILWAVIFIAYLVALVDIWLFELKNKRERVDK